MVQGWWETHHGGEFRHGYVPKDAYIVGDNAGFFGMCPMTPDFCYLAFPMVNPELPKEQRDETVDVMIEYAKIWAVQTNHPIVWISTHGEKFLSRLRQAGFASEETGMSHMFCKVGEIA